MVIDLNFDPDKILLEFIQLECKNYPIDAINILHEHPEVFKPKLLELLQKSSLKSGNDFLYDVDDRHIVALFTLAKYRAQEAYSQIIKLLQITGEIDDFFGDMITESIPIILAACFDGDLNKSKELILTKNIDCYVRLAPILSLEYLVITKQVSLSQAIEFIQQVAESIIDEGCEEDLKSGNILELILNQLAEFSIPEYDKFVARKNWKPQEPSLVFNFERELQYLRENYTEEDSYQKSQETWYLKRFDRLVNEGILSVSGWVGTEEDDDEINFNSLPIIKSPKIGRNDPCPCGSGKKYKKCCLA